VPNIAEYNATDTLKPDNMGAEAFAMEGRRVGQFYHQMGQDIGGGIDTLGKEAGKYQAFQEIGHLSATGAQVHNSLDQSLTDTLNKADPNDPTTAVKWREQVLEPALQQYQSAPVTPEGKQYAMQHANELRQFFNEKAIGGQADMAGAALMTNLQTMSNNAEYSAQQDPTSADLVRNTFRMSVQSMLATHPQLTPQQTAAFTQHIEAGERQITLAQGQGMAQKNPDAAIDAVKAGGPFANYLSQEDRDGLIRYATEQKQAGLIDQERQERAQKQQAEDQSQARAGQYLTAFGSTDTSSPTFVADATKRVLTDPTLLPATRDSLVSMASRLHEQGQNADKIVDDPNTLHSLITRIGSPNPPTQAEVMGQIGLPHGLSMSGADFVMSHINPKTPHDELDTKMLDAEMDLWKTGTSSGSLISGMPDVKGKQAYTDAINFYLPLIKQGEAAGIPMHELLAPPDAQHPNSIYHQRLIESFNPNNVPGRGGPTAAQRTQSTSILDSVTHVWQQFQGMGEQLKAATSGGGEAIAPIPHWTPSTLQPNTTPPQAGRPSLDQIFGN